MATASSFVDEVCALKRTVVALATEAQERERFAAEMRSVYQTDQAAGLRETKFLALYNTFLGLAMSMSFYVGYQMVDNDEIEAGNVTTAFFAVIIAGVSFAEVIPAKTSIAMGRAAARSCYDAIDAAIEIDNMSEAGLAPEARSKGAIEFKNVSFRSSTPPGPTSRCSAASASRSSRRPRWRSSAPAARESQRSSR